MTKFQSIKSLLGLLIVMAITVYCTMLWLDDIRPSFSSPSSEVGVDSSAPAFSFEDLLDAIEWEESKDGRYIYGDYKELPADWEPKESYPLKEHGRGVVPIYCEWDNELGKATYFEAQAVGDFQIHKIYVDDVNRIKLLANHYCYTPWTYTDRLNPEWSRWMVWRYLTHYGGTFEEMARKHQGGPNGHNKDCTKPYWEKVKARMESVQELVIKEPTHEQI